MSVFISFCVCVSNPFPLVKDMYKSYIESLELVAATVSPLSGVPSPPFRFLIAVYYSSVLESEGSQAAPVSRPCTSLAQIPREEHFLAVTLG